MTTEAKPEVKLIEYFDEHWYKLELKDQEPFYLASATTKLGVVAKPWLARWRGDIGNREADLRMFEAQESGVRIHWAFYVILTGGVVIYNPSRKPNFSENEISKLQDDYLGNVAVMRYQDEYLDVIKLHKWLQIVRPEIVCAEKTVYSMKYREAGTMDVLLKIKAGKYAINGKTPFEIKTEGLYVTDLKSGNGVDENADWQTACYAVCAEEMGLGEIQGTIILHTGAKVRTGIPGLATLLRTKEEVKKDFELYRHAAAIWEAKNSEAKPETYQFPSSLTLKGDLL